MMVRCPEWKKCTLFEGCTHKEIHEHAHCKYTYCPLMWNRDNRLIYCMEVDIFTEEIERILDI